MSRYARSGEHWTIVQRIKNDAVFAVAWLLVVALSRLPRPALRALGTFLGNVAYYLWPRARRIADRNLARATNDCAIPKGAAKTREVYRTLGQNLADTFLLLDPSERAERTLPILPGALDVLDEALGLGRGVVYITAHLGPWERMACALAARGRPITATVRGSYDRRLDGLVYDSIRRKRHVQTIDRASPGAPFAIVRALRRGRVVGFLIDLPGRVPTVPTVLFGRATRTPVGPARIALRTCAPVVVGTPVPHECGVAVSIERLDYTDLVGHTYADQALAQRMLDALGHRIVALPRHWPWMHPSFREELLKSPTRDGATRLPPYQEYR